MGLRDVLKGLVFGRNDTLGAVDDATAQKVVSGLSGPGAGGLPTVLARFQANGMDDIASSWVATGTNRPLSVDQLKQVFDPGTIASVADKLGISTNDAAWMMATELPKIIDKLTPDGRVPDPEALAKQLENLVER